MAQACDAQSLVTAASCNICNFPPGTQMPVLIYLACQILNGGSVQACDAQSLVTAAQCLVCNIPPGAQFAVLAYLLCQIANTGGGSGLAGTGSPQGVVTASPGTTYLDT